MKSSAVISSVIFVSFARSSLRNSNYTLDHLTCCSLYLDFFLSLLFTTEVSIALLCLQICILLPQQLNPSSNFLFQILYFQLYNSHSVFFIVSISLLRFSIFLHFVLLYESYCNRYFKIHILLVSTSGCWDQLTVFQECNFQVLILNYMLILDFVIFLLKIYFYFTRQLSWFNSELQTSFLGSQLWS